MSGPQYQLLPQAREDVVAISKYIGRDSVTAAHRFLDAFEATCDRLVALSRSGIKRTLKKAALHKMRMMPVDGFRAYLVFCRPTGNTIAVVRVIDGARDLPTIFSDDNEV